MIIRTAGGHDVASRSANFFKGSDAIPMPGSDGFGAIGMGRLVRTEDAIALTPVMAGIRLLAETIGFLTMAVERREGQNKIPLPETSQAYVLETKPNERMTPFDFVAYIVASLQRGNAYVLKAKDNSGVVRMLYPLQPERVVPKLVNGEMVYRVYEKGGSKTLTTADLIHIPGILWGHPYIGISPIELHARTLGGMVDAQEFGNRFFQNDGSPGGIITHPGKPSKPQREEMMEGWRSQHQGVSNSRKTGLLWDGMTYESVGVSMADAQYVESQKFGIHEVANILRVPAKRIGGEGDEAERQFDPAIDSQELLTYSLSPWIRRIEQGLALDDDLFPDKTVKPRVLTDELLRADFKTRMEGWFRARQAGIFTANDIRLKEGEPAIEGGDVLQLTPVGGAPNPTSPTT